MREMGITPLWRAPRRMLVLMRKVRTVHVVHVIISVSFPHVISFEHLNTDWDCTYISRDSHPTLCSLLWCQLVSSYHPKLQTAK